MEKQSIDFNNIFMLISESMVKSSPERLRIAYKEKNKSTSLDEEVEHFLKLDGERISKDIEIYVSLSKKYVFHALPDFFLVLLKVKKECPEAYRIGARRLKRFGKKFFEGKTLENWDKMFK